MIKLHIILCKPIESTGINSSVGTDNKKCLLADNPIVHLNQNLHLSYALDQRHRQKKYQNVFVDSRAVARMPHRGAMSLLNIPTPYLKIGMLVLVYWHYAKK